jgi:DNA-binding GntR family transcriptional regulator
MILSVLKDISWQDDSTNEEKSCQVGNRLSLRLFEGEFKPGDRIKVTAKGDKLVF